MKFYLFLLLLVGFYSSKSQGTLLLTIDQLNNRVANGSDTTYIINFWATWCVPCLKELPFFERLNQTAKAEKLKILLISVDAMPQGNRLLPAFIKKRNLQNEVWLLNEKNQQTFINRVDTSWSGAIPATLMIKKDQRRFFEKDFTYPELLAQYHKMQ